MNASAWAAAHDPTTWVEGPPVLARATAEPDAKPASGPTKEAVAPCSLLVASPAHLLGANTASWLERLLEGLETLQGSHRTVCTRTEALALWSALRDCPDEDQAAGRVIAHWLGRAALTPLAGRTAPAPVWPLLQLALIRWGATIAPELKSDDVVRTWLDAEADDSIVRPLTADRAAALLAAALDGLGHPIEVPDALPPVLSLEEPTNVTSDVAAVRRAGLIVLVLHHVGPHTERRPDWNPAGALRNVLALLQSSRFGGLIDTSRSLSDIRDIGRVLIDRSELVRSVGGVRLGGRSETVERRM